MTQASLLGVELKFVVLFSENCSSNNSQELMPPEIDNNQETEFDQTLANLFQEAQQHPFGSRPRQRVTERLWPLLGPKPTDPVANARLKGVKNGFEKKYGDAFQSQGKNFNAAWEDVHQDAWKTCLEKLDVYNKGIDSSIVKAWRKYCQPLKDDDETARDNAFQKLCQEVRGFPDRFYRRRQNPDNAAKTAQIRAKTEEIRVICENFIAQLPTVTQLGEAALKRLWNEELCDRICTFYRPLKVWNWFVSTLRFSILNMIRKTNPKIVADLDGEGNDQGQPNNWNSKVTQKIREQSNKLLPSDVINCIRSDHFGIFSGKHIEDHPQANFREIVLVRQRLIADKQVLKENITDKLEAHFGVKASVISSFYTRISQYFKPIIEELSQGELCLSLTAEMIERINTDAEGKFAKAKMPNHPKINFKQVVITRNEVTSWALAARALGLSENDQTQVKELIYFYLDRVRSFKIITFTKRNRRSTKSLNNNDTIGGN